MRSHHRLVAASALLPGLLAATVALALPAGGDVVAATPPKVRVRLTPACYQSGEHGVLTAAGFTPRATWTAKLGAHTLGSGHTDAHGHVNATFVAPTYHGTTGTRELSLWVSDGTHSARTTFEMTPLTATFTPHDGNPATLRVHWRVLGLTPDHGVYVHYIAPSGKGRTTVRIGMTSGICGTLKTRPIALFPFDYTYGVWTFQIDSLRHYSRATLPRLLIHFQIKKPKGKRT